MFVLVGSESSETILSAERVENVFCGTIRNAIFPEGCWLEMLPHTGLSARHGR